jgi:hypothetical protein
MRVIARAYGDEPLDRTTSGESDGVIFIVNLELNRSDHHSETGVGFPRSCVYQFDSELFDSLREVFGRGDAESLERLWSKAAPIGANVAA